MNTKNSIVELTNKEVLYISGGAACMAACYFIFGGNARRTCMKACEALPGPAM